MGANELEHKRLGQRAVNEKTTVAFDVPSELSIEMNKVRVECEG
jgi:hypothetical protein